MTNQVMELLKKSRKGIAVGGVLGAIFYFVSQKIPFLEFSTIQSSLVPEGLIDQLGVTLEIKTLLFFIVLGMILGLVVDLFIKKK